MFQEVCRKRINVNKYEETFVSWENSILTVRGNKNIHMIDFSYNLQSIEQTLDINECTITSNYESPLPQSYLANYAAQGLSNLELVEMITNPAFWSHNIYLAQEMTNVIAYKWSPENIINNHEVLIATVNSIGNVELYGSKKQIWSSVMNFSKEIKEYLQEEYVNLSKCPKEFITLQKAVYKLQTSSLCWSPKLNPDKSCYFVTGQKSGDILFWCLKQNNNSLDIKYYGKLSKEWEIVVMIWIPISTEKFTLLLSNEYGQIVADQCEIINEKINLLHEDILWSHKDRMIVTYLEYIKKDDNLLLFFNKHRHFVMQVYDKTFNLLSQSINNINDNKICCITKNGSVIYTGTNNIKIYKVEYSFKNNEILVAFKLLETKDSYTTYELCGLSFSKNGAILALTLIDRKVLYRQKTLKIDIAFLCPETDIENYALNIKNNSTRKLTDIWDHIELLRCKVIKTKKLPKLNYNRLLEEGESDIYKLKFYLICLILYDNLDKSISTNTIEPLPETSIDTIKNKILFLQAITVIKEIYEKHEKYKELTDFDNESFNGSKNYLYYYCELYSKNVTDYVTEDILNMQSSNIKYICQGCDEEIKDFSCPMGHLSMFCSLSFTLIDDDNYLVCKGCGAIARAELVIQEPTCVFCDLYLSNSCLPV